MARKKPTKGPSIAKTFEAWATLTPEERKADAERFDKLKPLEQLNALEDLINEFDEKIEEAERANKRRH